MKTFRKFKVAFVTFAIATLGLQSCANLSPEQNAGVGAGIGALLGGGIAALTGADDEGILLAAAGGAVLGGFVVYQYERKKASQRQMSVALKRAQAYETKKDAEWRDYQRKKAAAEARRKSIQQSKVKTATQKKQELVKIKTPPKPKKKSRYVAVKTERSSGSSGAASTVFYDTEKNTVADSYAYDLKKTPKQGEMVKVANYKAEYY